MRFWAALPIRARLAALAAAAVAVSIAGASAVAYVVVDHVLRQDLDRALAQQAIETRRDLDRRGWALLGPCTWVGSPCAQTASASAAVDPGDGALPVTSAVRRAAAGSGAAFYSDAQVGGHPVRVFTTPLAGGKALQVGRRADPVERNLARIRLALLLTALGGVAVAAGLGAAVARAALRPVGRLTAAVERVAVTRDPGHRMDATGSDELARLARGVNTMLGALEESIVAQRRLVADASHELRTPLTTLRADIDLLDRLPAERRERVVARVRGQLTGLGDLVGDLIELARGDEPSEPVEDVRLDRLVAYCLAEARVRWPAVTFTGDLTDSVVTGVPGRLSRAVANLLDNAAKFGGSAGPVEVGVRDAEISVRDHGPGIDPSDAPHVFERFYRATTARGLSGSGLGLAIVAQVARDHSAEVSAEPAPGGGTLVRFRLRAG